MVQSVPIAPSAEYLNITELLVKEELDRQLAQLSPRILRFIRRAEVETYALNRLPALYASSTQGLQFQQQRAQRELQHQLQTAVRQAIAAVQVDPLRVTQPLAALHSNASPESEAVLQALRSLFNQPDLNWAAALKRLQQLQAQHNPALANAGAPATEAVADSAHTHRQRWRPGTYGGEVAWKPKPAQAQTLNFDWSDPRYQR